MRSLNQSAVALSGINLIEASAGTGKTYAITSLYLRLLVEKELLPEQILVVTYTEAATKELRKKIRDRISAALEVLAGRESDDEFLAAFAEKSRTLGLKRVTDSLEQALRAFDTASIFTIHGFCLRALQDNAFESGSLYDTELVTDQSELLQEILDDFWRVHFFRESAPLLSYALKKRAPMLFRELLRGLHAGSGVRVIPEFSDEEIGALEAGALQSYREISRQWLGEKEAIQELIKSDKGLARSAESYRADLLEPLFAKMDAFILAGNHFDLFEGFEKFTSSGIVKGSKPKGTPPQHPFFERCEALLAGVNQRFLALQAEQVAFYKESLPRRKRAANVRFFDDLLDDLCHALDSESGGSALAGLLRKKYQAALIDEFQDTDPVQYDIFRKIYADSDAPLFLIGDPKQAIYSFRGADIFAYMRAAREVSEERRFTLTENWRSIPPLLGAFNTIFQQQGNPFLYDGIVYHPLKAGNPEKNLLPVTDSPPMQLWLMDSREQKSGMLSVDEANQAACNGVVGEIIRLLEAGRQGEALINGRPLASGDMAVIVRTHRQASLVMSALRAKGIAAVVRSDKSIFLSHEADEVRILLAALAEPSNETRVRSALVTDMLGRTGNGIAALLEDEAMLSPLLAEFHEYHLRWMERGFMVMIRELMAKEGVRGRLLGYSDGERRLTNTLHCFELLHREEHERRVGPEGLFAWFSEQSGASESAEEYQIRLETDEEAVRIVTVHVSKGLQYPVVFCPFLWSGGYGGGKMALFHNDAGELVRDFGSASFAEHQSRAARESLAESLRLLYVALTRAEFRCYLISGKTRSESSPLNYLFHASPETRMAENQATALALESAALSAEKMEEELQALSESSEGSIGFTLLKPDSFDSTATVLPLKAASVDTPPYLRPAPQAIDTAWRVSSFTSFSHHSDKKPVELPDRDEPIGEAEAPVAAADEKSIFTFHRGAQAGIFMHEIFEQLNFAAPDREKIQELVEKGLERYNYRAEWLPHIITMVENVLNTPLSSEGGAYTLGTLEPGSWITELEFFFPLKQITSSLMGDALLRHGVVPGAVDLASLARSLNFREVKGMVMGFMDMVFQAQGRYYLLDWKSNHLGYTLEDYGPEAMKRGMEQNLYPLQYLLYTVALNRYLSLRVKEYSYSTHFGGVIYVFLRGANSKRGETRGFFRDTPAESLINELTQILIKEGE